MFGKLLFFFVFPKLGISYKVKKDTCCYGVTVQRSACDKQTDGVD